MTLLRALVDAPPSRNIADAVLLTDGTNTLLHRQLHALVARAHPVARSVVGLEGASTFANATATLEALAGGAVPTWYNPRAPHAMRARADAVAGVGQRSSHADVACMVMTSGSTRAPKAVALSVDALVASARGSQTRVPFGEGDSWLWSLPLCHVGGLMVLLRAVASQGAVAIPTIGESLADALMRLRPSHVSLVPTQLMRLLRADLAVDRVLKSCRDILVGGAPAAPALLAEGIARGWPLRQTWGMTETAAQAATSLRSQPFTCGLPMPEMHIDITNAGVIRVRGTQLFSGYVDATRSMNPVSACDEDGFFATGDIGGMTTSGLRITGRADRRFISGGENVHPESIALELSDASTVVHVVAVDDDEWGQRAVAFVDALDDVEATCERLARHSREVLPAHMRPVVFLPLPDGNAPKPSLSTLQTLAQAHPVVLQHTRATSTPSTKQ